MTIYPDAPWNMRGQLWLSVFRIRTDIDALRPAGTYGVAFVDYEPDSPLTYSELLVARPVKEPARGVSITDIWVDSPESVAGGRELWAIPKGLCDFERDLTHTGPVSRARWSASLGGQRIASANFTDISRAAPRVPFKGATWQPGIDDTGGQARRAILRGGAKTLPCKGSWDFDPAGPLGWLAGRKPVVSAKMADFTMSFG